MDCSKCSDYVYYTFDNTVIGICERKECVFEDGVYEEEELES